MTQTTSNSPNVLYKRLFVPASWEIRSLKKTFQSNFFQRATITMATKWHGIDHFSSGQGLTLWLFNFHNNCPHEFSIWFFHWWIFYHHKQKKDGPSGRKESSLQFNNLQKKHPFLEPLMWHGYFVGITNSSNFGHNLFHYLLFANFLSSFGMVTRQFFVVEKM